MEPGAETSDSIMIRFKILQMFFHRWYIMAGWEKDPEWVKENIQWFCNRLNIKPAMFPKVWPIVQSYNDPNIISAEEFEKVLRYGAGAQATGVMMFTSCSVAEDEKKIETMKKVYTEWTNRWLKSG